MKRKNPADLTRRNEQALKRLMRRLEQRIVLLAGDVRKIARGLRS